MQSEGRESLDEIRRQLKELLVVNLGLEDITAEGIKDDEMLFGEGIGLDSLDAVEIVVLVQRKYGVEIVDEEQAREILQSIDTLARWVHEKMKK